MVCFLVDQGNICLHSTIFGAVNVVFNFETENILDMLSLTPTTSSKQTWYVVNHGLRVPG